MTSPRALFAALVALLAAAVDRVRVRWYRHRRLPTVRASLAAGQLPPPGRLTALRVPDQPLAADDRSPDYLSIPSSSRLVTGRPSLPFRVASTRILPPPLRPLEVVRVAEPAWLQPPPPPRRKALRLPALAALPEGPPVLVRPELFGLAPRELSTRTERAGLPPKLLGALVREREPLVEAPSPRPRPIGVADPTAFGLTPGAQPAAEAVPLPRRHPPRLSRARANFHVRYVDPQRTESFLPPLVTTWGELFDKSVEGYFGDPDLGAIEDVFEWEIDDEIEVQMRAVREQFTLRRDINRHEFDPDELGRLEQEGDEALAAIQAFTGLAFEDLEPEPWAPLKMRLALPLVEVAPFTESAERQLAWLLSAIKEHPPEEAAPTSKESDER